MSSNLTFTILGCGNSAGLPVAGNEWGKCDPNEPKNRRFRCSALVQSENTTLVIDTGADFRHQMNLHEIKKIDAVFYTHEHSDHILGIDDLRAYFFRNGKNPVPCYGKKSSLDVIRKQFEYLFIGGSDVDLYPPLLEQINFEPEQYKRIQNFKDVTYTPFLMDHGTCQAVGYRFGDLSYCVDMKSLDQTALDIIKGSKIWVVDGAGYKSDTNPVHANLEVLYEYNDYIQAEEVYVTCLSGQMDYHTLCEELPNGFYPAYDGLVLSI
ncbi:MAG: MBL fold metallo-hydrolase [Alphaproteobacteria bacterium]|nr:MBL fold metallo-hydrolase [Alphaproteobacteria bacterium]